MSLAIASLINTIRRLVTSLLPQTSSSDSATGEPLLKMGTPFPLLSLPTDLLRSALFGGTPLHELAPLLTSLRATNHQMLAFCCAVTGEVYDAVQARALSAVTGFPAWHKRNDQQVAVVPMEEWVTTFITEARRVWKGRLAYGSTHRTTSAGIWHTASDVVYIVNALGLENGSSVPDDGSIPDDGEYRDEHQELCYTLCSGADMKLCTEGTIFVHVCLASVAEWFRLHGGWRLDACAAMLFSRACARKMDAGSSWMMNYAYIDALECHALLEEVQAFVLQKIRMGREAELLGALRRAYGAEWTTMTHDKVFALFTGPGCIAVRLKRGEGSRAVKEDLRTLRTRLLDEVQVEAVQAETVAILTRKLNACLPATCYR